MLKLLLLQIQIQEWVSQDAKSLYLVELPT